MIVFVDTNLVIDTIEQRVPWAQNVGNRLSAVALAGDSLGLSDLTMMECYVGPIKTANAHLHSSYDAYFQNPFLSVLQITAKVYYRAAQIRAKYNLKVIDSIHLATAVEHKCALFLTRDKAFLRFPDVPVEVIT